MSESPNPFDLERHIIIRPDMGEIPTGALEAYCRSLKEGVPTSLVKYPVAKKKYEWYVICTAGQGPMIIWEPEMGPWIERIEDLFHHLGCDNEAGLKRAIYKGTSCGAWLSTFGPGRVVDRKEKQIWTAFYSLVEVDGVWKVVGSGFNHDGAPSLDAPRDVLSYFHIDHNGNCSLDAPFVSGMVPNSDDIIFVKRVNNQVEVRARFNVSIYRYHQGGIEGGSIVEGVDQTTETYTLYYPFHMKQFWDLFNDVESEATSIWNDTHGCETCAKHWGSSEHDFSGNVPVWDECPDCKGQGAII